MRVGYMKSPANRLGKATPCSLVSLVAELVEVWRDLDFHCVMRLSDPIGVWQARIHASSEC